MGIAFIMLNLQLCVTNISNFTPYRKLIDITKKLPTADPDARLYAELGAGTKVNTFLLHSK